jgi:hypothetical protein
MSLPGARVEILTANDKNKGVKIAHFAPRANPDPPLDNQAQAIATLLTPA